MIVNLIILYIRTCTLYNLNMELLLTAENMECNDADIRLSEESASNIIEVCFTGTWGGICPNAQNEIAQKTGMVACRQLGFSSLG